MLCAGGGSTYGDGGFTGAAINGGIPTRGATANGLRAAVVPSAVYCCIVPDGYVGGCGGGINGGTVATAATIVSDAGRNDVAKSGFC